MGERSVDLALATAHAADPDADLCIKEYRAEEDGGRWDALLALVERLQDRGVPIDGIGSQNHEHGPDDRAGPETFRAHVQELASIGLSARTSETDVVLDDGEPQDVQARQPVGRLAGCLEEPAATTFGTWGFTERYGSTAGVGEYPLPTGDALPWDEDMAPEKAFAALLARLRR